MNNEEFSTLSKNSLRILYGLSPGPYTIVDLMRFLNRSETSAYLAVKELKKWGFAKLVGKSEFTLLAQIKIECTEPVEESVEVVKKRGAEKELLDNAKEILRYLNRQAGKNFRVNASNCNLIVARLREQYNVDECKRVIDYKVRDWGNDPVMRTYLRPQTLFSNKFESYLNSRCENSYAAQTEDVSRRMNEMMAAPIDYELPDHLDF